MGMWSLIVHKESQAQELVMSEAQAAECCVVYATCADIEEARHIGMLLVQGKFAACVNLLPTMHSIYLWEGTVAEAQEAILLAKTTRELSPLTVNRIVELHSYECPAVFVLPISAGSVPYLNWIAEVVSGPMPEPADEDPPAAGEDDHS